MIDRIVAFPGGSRGLVLNVQKPWETGIYITEITGLEPPDAEISLTPDPYFGGSSFVNAHIPQRDIGITFQYDWANTSKARRIVESIFVSGRPIRLEIYQGLLQVEIEGYVETIETERFSDEVSTEVHILCPEPYFYVFGDNGTTTKTLTPKNRLETPAHKDDRHFQKSAKGSSDWGAYKSYGAVSLNMFGDYPVGVDIEMRFSAEPKTMKEIVVRGQGPRPQAFVLDVDKMAELAGGRAKLPSAKYVYSSVDGRRRSHIVLSNGQLRDGRFIFKKKEWIKVWQYNDDLDVMVSPSVEEVLNVTFTAHNKLLGFG